MYVLREVRLLIDPVKQNKQGLSVDCVIVANVENCAICRHWFLLFLDIDGVDLRGWVLDHRAAVLVST